MTTKHDNILEAKKSIKYQIKFLESLLDSLKDPSKVIRNRALFATYCIHRYLNDKFVLDVEEAMKEAEDVQH